MDKIVRIYKDDESYDFNIKKLKALASIFQIDPTNEKGMEAVKRIKVAFQECEYIEKHKNDPVSDDQDFKDFYYNESKLYENPSYKALIIQEKKDLLKEVLKENEEIVSHYGLEDLFHSAVLGMVTAINRYDPQKDFSFDLLAKFWINRTIKEFSLDNNYSYQLREKIDVYVDEYMEKFDKPNKENIIKRTTI